MKLTKRDVEIMQFINKFGFCEIIQIEKKFNLKKPRSYQIMRRLVSEKLVIHERVFHGRHGIFYLSKHGSSFTDMPPLVNIPVNTYDHQLAIIDLYFKLSAQYPEAEWVSERQMKHDKLSKGIGSIGHIADGMLIFPDDTKIAIEVEPTMKGKLRLEKIFRAYGGQFDVKEVWYYCSDYVFPKLQKATQKKSYIKVSRINEELSCEIALPHATSLQPFN